MSKGGDDSEDSSSSPDCCGCASGVSENYTPCCHVGLCDNCYTDQMVKECSLCSNDEEICTACKGINEKSCGCDVSE